MKGHESVTVLVFLSAFVEVQRDLDRARRAVAEAKLALTICREKLDCVVDHAFAQRKFGPIETLFREEEAARKVCERAMKHLARSEERWVSMRAALASEEEQAQAWPILRHRLH